MTGTVLLTGATGFVGRHVLRALAERGARVRAVVREGKQGQIESLDGVDTVLSTPDLFAENADWWADGCKDIDTLIHVAWYAEPGKYLQSSKNWDCLRGTLQLAEGASRAGVKRFIGVGTCFEYDLTDGLLTIQTPLRPITPYAQAKAETFTTLSKSLPQRGVEFAWCRLFYLYGENEDSRRLVPYLRKKLAAGEHAELTSGTQIRDFLDVMDAARMVVATALSEIQGPINICSEVPISVRQLAERIADEYGRRDLLNFGARPENLIEPPSVVGIRSKVLP